MDQKIKGEMADMLNGQHRGHFLGTVFDSKRGMGIVNNIGHDRYHFCGTGNFSVTVRYSVLQCVTVCYRVLQCVTVFYSVLQRVTLCYCVLQCSTECYIVLRCVTMCYNVLQCVTAPPPFRDGGLEKSP